MSDIIIIDGQGNSISTEEFADISATPQIVSEAIASRATDPGFSASTAYLPNPDPVLKKSGQDIEVYEDMLADAQVWHSFEKLCGGAQRHRYEIRQGKMDNRAYDFLRDFFADFKWNSFVEAVLRARMFGYQPLEISWAQTSDGFVVPASVDVIAHRRIKFSAKDNSPLLITKDEKEGIWKPEWDNSFLFPRYHSTRDNPYGTPALSRCFWNVVAKRGGMKFWMTFIEKYGTPWFVIYAPSSATKTQKEELLAAGKKAIRDAVLVLPDNVRHELVHAQGTGSTDMHDKFLQYHDKQISKAITSEALAGDNSGVGSYASSNTAESILDTAIAACVELVTESAKELAKKIEILNFGTGVVGQFDAYDPTFTNKGVAELDKILFGIGVKPTAQYIAKTYKRSDTDFTIVDMQSNPDAGILQSQNSEFAANAADTSGLEQEAIDELAETLFEDTTGNHKMMELVLKPIVDFIDGTESFESAQQGLAKIFPEMKTDKLEQMFLRLMLTAQTWGKETSQNDAED